ncbi:RNA polymerase sigma-I factor [Jeotgalibacillus haloalkalitolerans]|uniref:RNA polymerase sigma factor SigI n=1 Tax=Jeotgalibacillus haloalkalitolerans TaxID=3104292 RepID=A0ABU5KQH2_9BACL|nr:RNA polymerase sigma-I factor [Jeotgalibacillus sp. HH7-29]MDZ5712950.1 RNA polymerase sigma-I factor [Jeotgalibacillus sp. HH7-29]
MERLLSFLLFGLYKFSSKMTLEEKVVHIQSGDTQLLSEVLEDYKPFVKKAASKICHRYIYDSDDEFSIALIAFNDALMKYQPEKGASVISFSEIVIKRRMIDYIRTHRKEKQEMLFEPGGESLETARYLENDQSMKQYQSELESELRKEEIAQYTLTLKAFGLTFSELVNCSPKHQDARKNAIFIAKLVSSNKEWFAELKDKKRLPIKKIEKEVEVSRKTIERNRKYIIAVAVLLNGRFPYLYEYVKEQL